MVTLIAEIGVAHKGDVKLAMALVDKAKDAGFDRVKMQVFRADKISDDIAKYKPYELSYDDHKKVFEHCAKVGIDYSATPFDVDAVTFLLKMGCKHFKVASTDITFVDLLMRMAVDRTAMTSMTLSTGGATEREVSTAIASLRPTLLYHCVVGYPPDVDRLHISRIRRLRIEHGLPVGYSDHSPTYMPCGYAALLALGVGAVAIERHIGDGADAMVAESGARIKEWVQIVRSGEASMPDPGPSPACDRHVKSLRRGPDGLRHELVEEKKKGAGSWSDPAKKVAPKRVGKVDAVGGGKKPAAKKTVEIPVAKKSVPKKKVAPNKGKGKYE